MEGYVAYRFNELFTPFAGLGFRIVYDDSGGQHSANSGDFYDRRNMLLYVPVGVRVNPIKDLSLKTQGNYLLRGWQKSYNSDTFDQYPNAHNTQDEGWGVDVTVNYQMTDKWSAYSFYRYWNIDRSDNDCGNVVFNGFVCWWEPENTTQEIGVGVAYRF